MVFWQLCYFEIAQDRGTTVEYKFTVCSNFVSYLTGTIGGGNGTAPTQRLTQPSKQQSPWAGQSVSLTPGLQQVLTLPAHDDPTKI